MTVSHPYECSWCEQRWTSPISAAMCCDEASNALHDPRLDKPERFYLSED